MYHAKEIINIRVGDTFIFPEDMDNSNRVVYVKTSTTHYKPANNSRARKIKIEDLEMIVYLTFWERHTASA